MLLNPTPITVDELAAGLAVTVITTVVTTTTVATPSVPVVVDDAGMVRGAEGVSPVAVTLDTVGEGAEVGEDAPEELVKPVVAFNVALTAVVLAMVVVKVPLATVGDEVVPLVVGLPNPNVGAYDEPN